MEYTFELLWDKATSRGWESLVNLILIEKELVYR